MPSVLKYTPCRSCGHQHHFCLPVGEVAPRTEYAYFCPETATHARLQPETPGKAAHFYPLGAVMLESPRQRAAA